jgi:hypothetical protein
MALTTRSAIKGYIALTTEAACGSGVQIEAALIECPPMYGQGEDVRMRRFWQVASWLQGRPRPHRPSLIRVIWQFFWGQKLTQSPERSI